MRKIFCTFSEKKTAIIAVINNKRETMNEKTKNRSSVDKTLGETEESARAVTRGILKIIFFWKFVQNLQNKCVLEFSFNEVSGLETCNFIKK